ncbi:hypothetical protein A7D01_14030 [Xanthomonas arboricola]|nr:hypothetical protein A7D01_14030 [Xanthomonas arboricola]
MQTLAQRQRRAPDMTLRPEQARPCCDDTDVAPCVAHLAAPTRGIIRIICCRGTPNFEFPPETIGLNIPPAFSLMALGKHAPASKLYSAH